MSQKKITITTSDGRTVEYPSVEAWRADVERERTAGKPRWDVPAVTSKPCDGKGLKPFYAYGPQAAPKNGMPARVSKPKGPRRYTYDNPRPRRSSAMSMSGLSSTNAASTLTKQYAKLTRTPKGRSES